MKPKIVGPEEFDRLVKKELADKFHQAVADGTADELEGGEFMQLQTTLDFVVSARKKKPHEPEPEPCCVCFRSGQGIVCSGDCCIEVILPES